MWPAAFPLHHEGTREQLLLLLRPVHAKTRVQGDLVTSAGPKAAFEVQTPENLKQYPSTSVQKWETTICRTVLAGQGNPKVMGCFELIRIF